MIKIQSMAHILPPETIIFWTLGKCWYQWFVSGLMSLRSDIMSLYDLIKPSINCVDMLHAY